jgi:hypothetical protein
MELQVLKLAGCQLEHEVGWKSIEIARDSTIQVLGGYAIKDRQI